MPITREDRNESEDVTLAAQKKRIRGERGPFGPNLPLTKAYTIPSIDEYLRERLMPVEGAIPHIPGIEMFGSQMPEQKAKVLYF